MISIIKRDNIYQLAGYKSRKVPTFSREYSKLCFLINSDFLIPRSAMQSLPIQFINRNNCIVEKKATRRTIVLSIKIPFQAVRSLLFRESNSNRSSPKRKEGKKRCIYLEKENDERRKEGIEIRLDEKIYIHMERVFGGLFRTVRFLEVVKMQEEAARRVLVGGERFLQFPLTH